MGRKGPRRPSVPFVELMEPDPARVADGLRILGRMIPQAYARDMAPAKSNGHGDPAWIPLEEESNDATEE